MSPATAQQRSIINPSFELGPALPSNNNYIITSHNNVLGWFSTTGQIELWGNGFQGIPAHSGRIFAEMNAYAPGALYQNLCLTNGETISWSFAHRARSGGSNPQVALFEIASTAGVVRQLLATQTTFLNQGWRINSGTTTYSGPTGQSRIQFRTTNPGSLGNFLDSIQIQMPSYVEFAGSTSKALESVANPPGAFIAVTSGNVTSTVTVPFMVTGGTATQGVDYILTGNSITIPPGNYNATPFHLPITILSDGVLEPDETIQLTLGTPSNPAAMFVASLSCTGAPNASVVHTIVDVPVAATDSSTGNTTNMPVTVDVLANDNAAPGRSLNPASVTIVGSSGPGAPLVVPGEGTWSVNSTTGAITFTPVPGFTTSPAPVSYSVADSGGNVSNAASVTVGYAAQAPVANSDTSIGNLLGATVTVDVLSNDSDPDGTLDPASVTIAGSSGPGGSLVVPGEGTWSVDTTTGAITFTPLPGFTGDPAPVSYTVADNDGNVSNSVSLTVDYDQQPTITVTKTVLSTQQLFPTVWSVTFAIDVVNTGNIALSNFALMDDLNAFAAPASLLPAQYPVALRVSGFGSATANPTYDGQSDTSLLAPGATLTLGGAGHIEVDVTYSTAAGFPAGGNTVTASSPQLAAPAMATATVPAGDSDGDGVPDSVEGCTAANDRDGDGICDAQDYDPTGYFYCEDTGTIIAGGSITVSGPLGSQSGAGSSNGITIVSDGSGGAYQFFVTQAGRYTLTPTYPSTASPSTTRVPTSAPVDVTGLGPNPAVLGSAEVGTTGQLADFSTAANTPSYLVFDIEAGDPQVLSNNLAMTGCAGNAAITATKTANKNAARKGESVTFTMTFTNNKTTAATGLRLVDDLPPGMVYTPGTAIVNGSAAEPIVVGHQLVWAPYNILAGQTTTMTMTTRLAGTAAFGTLKNSAWVETAGGQPTSNIATATVRVEPEHVFDCSDVIGKVFDDTNMNGYQDEGEEGIAGARVVTIRGLRITADEHGRFHVPCAELPASTGSNFTLKLDTRSLPSGYRVTTENPRTIRLTAGKMARMNFGAAISNVIELDLADAAFAPGSAAPSNALTQGIVGLVETMRQQPSVLRLSYHAASETPKLMRARLDAVEELLRKAWAKKGTYRLIIERTAKWVQ